MQADTTIFFDFLKALQFNYLWDFRPSEPKKKLRKTKKTPKKSPAKASQTDASALRVHRNLEKSLANFLKCTKKTKKITRQRKFPRQNTQMFFCNGRTRRHGRHGAAWGGVVGSRRRLWWMHQTRDGRDMIKKYHVA